MFRHIVLLTLTQDATEVSRQAILDGLATLPGRIPNLRTYTFGVDAGINEGNADVVAVADFDDVDGYLVYRDHEAHHQVINDFIKPVLASRAAVQYEF
jgi:hypothetical protein